MRNGSVVANLKGTYKKWSCYCCPRTCICVSTKWDLKNILVIPGRTSAYLVLEQTVMHSRPLLALYNLPRPMFAYCGMTRIPGCLLVVTGPVLSIRSMIMKIWAHHHKWLFGFPMLGVIDVIRMPSVLFLFPPCLDLRLYLKLCKSPLRTTATC